MSTRKTALDAGMDVTAHPNAVSWEPQAPAPAVLAFDLGGTRIKAGIVRGSCVSSLQVEPTDDREENAALAALLRLGHRLMVARAVDAVGVSVKGIVDPVGGVVRDVKERLVGLVGQPLVAILAQEFGRPAYVENDARMYALGEWSHGAGHGHRNVVCLTLGTGVGSGVVLGGRLLRGPRGVGGILAGHATVEVNGPTCTCGNVGCLEAVIGTAGFVRMADEAVTRDPSPSMLRHAPRTPNTFSRRPRAGTRSPRPSHTRSRPISGRALSALSTPTILTSSCWAAA